jgi:hypothetical protein
VRSTVGYVKARSHWLTTRSFAMISWHGVGTTTASCLSQTFCLFARLLLEHHPLRTYDALHLASALLVNDQLVAVGLPPLTFLAADNRLLTAATLEGLTVDNPNNYP